MIGLLYFISRGPDSGLDLNDQASKGPDQLVSQSL